MTKQKEFEAKEIEEAKEKARNRKR